MTLRELVWMAESRESHLWDHTASVICKIHNVNCAKKSDLMNITDFHPYMKATKRGIRITKANVGELRARFAKKK